MAALKQKTETIILVQRTDVTEVRKEVLLVNSEHFPPFRDFHHSHICTALAPITCMINQDEFFRAYSAETFT